MSTSEIEATELTEVAPDLGSRRRIPAASMRMLLFGAIGLSGFVPNLSVLFALTSLLDIHYVLAGIVSTQVAIAWNFVLLERFVYRGLPSQPRRRRAGAFAALNNADLLLRIPMVYALVEWGHLTSVIATVISLVIMFFVRFLITDRLIYQIRARRSER